MSSPNQWHAQRGLDAEGRVQSVFHLRSLEVHRLFALRARLRGSARHLRADDLRPRLRQPCLAWHERSFLGSECVSCGACVQACPTAHALTEKSVIEIGQPEHSLVTTCAYCGVGCTFKAEMRGRGSRAHGAVQGTARPTAAIPASRAGLPGLYHPQGAHPQPDDPRQHGRKCRGMKRSTSLLPSSRGIQAKYGRDAVGGITSSRCTNEETYLVQKLIRAGFGNNNVDTCARVCHSPTAMVFRRPSVLPPAPRISTRSSIPML